MKSFEEEKLKEALINAHRTRDDLEPPGRWAEEVMNHIRRLEPVELKQGFLMQFEHLVWHFAPVVCVLIVALAFYIIRMDFVPEYEIAEVIIDNPIGFVLVGTAII